MANNFSFFIYDYESFGINPASDRPAQFAGIRTDADFNIIGEPVMLYCKQTNDHKNVMKRGFLNLNLPQKF